MKEEFCYLLRVRYAECDAQQVVFNGRYVDYIDIAATEFFRIIWGDYKEMLSLGIDTQVVNVSVNWKGPAHFDDVLAITVKVQRIGNTSFTLGINYYQYPSLKSIATGEITYVLVTTKDHTKMTIPPETRLLLEKGGPGVIVNHAGVEEINLAIG